MFDGIRVGIESTLGLDSYSERRGDDLLGLAFQCRDHGCACRRRLSDRADETGRVQGGRGRGRARSAAHIRLALWCEAHGLTAERLKHLSLAVLYDPANTLARGLMGLVAYHGKWDRPDVVGQQIQNDPAHQAMVQRIPRPPGTHARQGRGADEAGGLVRRKGLKEQALAHYSEVTRLDPSREAAWKHLGYKKQGSRWVKPEEAAAAKQEATHQKQADKHWKTKLEKLRDGLESKDAAKRAKAEQGLTEVTDPRAVPMIWAIFVRGGERQQIAAVQMLGQIDGPSASNGLAVLAVFSPRPRCGGGRPKPETARSARRRRAS